jgi:hypothetical protein
VQEDLDGALGNVLDPDVDKILIERLEVDPGDR